MLHACCAGKEAKGVGNRRDFIIEGCRKRLAGVVGFQFGEGGAVRFDAIGKAQQHGGSVLGDHLRPGRRCSLRRGHRRIHLGETGFRDLGNAAAARGIQNPLDRALTRNQRSVDQ